MLKIKLPSFTAARSSVPGAVTPVSAAHTVPAPAAINSRLFGQTGGTPRGNASLEERERQGYTWIHRGEGQALTRAIHG